jgi:broad specificity phosphatase PhoE
MPPVKTPDEENQQVPESARSARVPGVFDQAFLTDVEGVTEIYFVRHAQPDINFEGVVGDSIDPPLTEHGRMQARLVGEALSTVEFSVIYSSPMKRAMETADAIVGHHKGMEKRIVADLAEVGIFKDIPPDQKVAEFLGMELLLGVRQRMLNERSWDVYPYSESSHDFRKRTINAIEGCIAPNAGTRIAIVCHGGVINAYTGHIVQSPFDMMFRPAHASITICVAGENRRVIRLLNDTHHLSTGEGEFVSY